jgi:hypothetical protein
MVRKADSTAYRREGDFVCGNAYDLFTLRLSILPHQEESHKLLSEGNEAGEGITKARAYRWWVATKDKPLGPVGCWVAYRGVGPEWF